ncbi:MAG TPA: hypothetical protein VMM38_01400 [Aridibacter sp.]|nr:hypothetical protein [Aridibacter sp.]
MTDKQKIDERVDEKIDEKIDQAQLPEVERPPVRKNVPPRTTAEEDRRTSGQRDINLIWERTQRHIALSVVTVTCLVAAAIIGANLVRPCEAGGISAPIALVLAAFILLSDLSFLVAGFYFGRTNHARIGDEKTRSMDDR